MEAAAAAAAAASPPRRPRRRVRISKRPAAPKKKPAVSFAKSSSVEKWRECCDALDAEVRETPPPPLHGAAGREVLATPPRLKRAAPCVQALAPPARHGWVEAQDRWFRQEDDCSTDRTGEEGEEWLFKPDDGAFFHTASGTLWVEVAGVGLVREDIARARATSRSVAVAFATRGGRPALLQLLFRGWVALRCGAVEVARAYGVCSGVDESPNLRLPLAASGLSPTTVHVQQRGVDGPPLAAAWVASADCEGWFYSRTSSEWVFCASEEVLYHATTKTLWKVDGSARCVLHRMDTRWRRYLLGFAEADARVLARVCLVSWRGSVPAGSDEAGRALAQMCVCTVCLDHFLVAGAPSSSGGAGGGRRPSCAAAAAVGGAVRFAGCSHVICTECLGGYAVSAVEMHQWTADGLPCPSPGCAASLSGEVVLGASALTAPQRDDVAAHLCRLLVARPVYCPSPGCGAVFEAAGPQGGCARATCSECGADFCRDCRCIWHAGQTCAEYRRRPNAMDLSLLTLAAKSGWRRCGSCGAMVERLDGCNHMQCSQCGHHFCYRCGGPFDKNSYQCLDVGCGIYQDQGQADTAPQAAQRVTRSWGRWLWPEPAPELTEDRKAVLARWAGVARPGAQAAVDALAQRGPLLVMAGWQRELLRSHLCPYCKRAMNSARTLGAHLRYMCRGPVWICCERLFRDAEEMNLHVHARHLARFNV